MLLFSYNYNNMKKYLAGFITFLLFSFVSIANAQSQKTPSNPVPCNPSCSSGTCTLCNPLTVSTPQAFIGLAINAVLGVVGSLALLMFIYGGLTWMTSSGNEEKVKKGREIIIWSAIGLVVIFMSYALTRFLLGTITQPG